MIVDRYYYHQLNNDDKYLYKIMYKGVMDHEDIIPLPIKGVFPQESFARLFDAITLDNPLIYFLNQTLCKLGKDENNNYAILPQYYFTPDQVKKYSKKIQETVNNLAYQLKLNEGSDFEKELKIHDWICKNVIYDTEGMQEGNIKANIASHNILGVFAYRKAQCEGIAKAVKVLLNAVDVRCIVVNGDAVVNGVSEKHSWNIVNLDGTPYQLDVTWDVGLHKPDGDRIRYDYFNVTDDMIKKNHRQELNDMPTCALKELNYFVRNGTSFRNKSQVIKYIKNGLNKNMNNFYFRYDGKAKVSSIFAEIIELIKQHLIDNDQYDKQIKRSLNDEIGTCWIGIF